MFWNLLFSAAALFNRQVSYIFPSESYQAFLWADFDHNKPLYNLSPPPLPLPPPAESEWQRNALYVVFVHPLFKDYAETLLDYGAQGRYSMHMHRVPLYRAPVAYKKKLLYPNFNQLLSPATSKLKMFFFFLDDLVCFLGFSMLLSCDPDQPTLHSA
jgi:hypothetical protein